MRFFLNRAHFLIRICLIFVFLFSSFNLNLASIVEADDWARKGKFAMQSKKYVDAETYFSKALESDPENPHLLYSLAQVKVHLNKISEAKPLLDKVLAMPESNGRDVIVFYKGQTEGEEAELVDQIVLPPQRTNNNMRNYVDVRGNEPIPQYRLFFKKKGQMELVPQTAVRLQYKGVLGRVYADVKTLSDYVNKQLIAKAGANESIEMASLPGGCFMMGSDKGSHDERPVHEVCLSPFKLDKYEVTQSQFQAQMGSNPSAYVGGNLPVDSITWDEANRYCKAVGKRLPTEAEFEYAIRGGKDDVFYWGNKVTGKEANFCDKDCDLNIRVEEVSDGYKTTAPVGQFPPNPYGLYDIVGNLAEWTSDWMDENYYRNSPKDNPPGSYPSRHKVARGGAWNTIAGYMRATNRAFFEFEMRIPGVGFRCASSS